MKTLKYILTTLILFNSFVYAYSQTDSCGLPFNKIVIESQYLEADRSIMVALPPKFDPAKKYPVLYVLDAEWRFELVRHLMIDLVGNKMVPPHIIIGIPHVEMNIQRCKDLTFSVSDMEYDGDKVSWYHAENSGQAAKFYDFITKELIPTIDKEYNTTNDRGLVGHSLGGYFAAYIMCFKPYFNNLQIYDPSIWWGNGEVTRILTSEMDTSKALNVYISYQPIPEFHANKIEELIELLQNQKHITLSHHQYAQHTHMSLFIPSFMEGMQKAFLNRLPKE